MNRRVISGFGAEIIQTLQTDLKQFCAPFRAADQAAKAQGIWPAVRTLIRSGVSNGLPGCCALLVVMHAVIVLGLLLLLIGYGVLS